ncbi:MAG: ATP-binding protein [Thermoanaerobaculia bacterium]
MTGDAASELLASLAALAPEVLIVVADADGRILEMNETARLGVGGRGTAGLVLSDLFARGDAPKIAALLEGPPGRSGPRLVNFVDAAGDPFTVRAVVETSAGGLVLAGVRIVEDEGRLGNELVRLNNELVAADRESARRGRELERALAELRRHRDALEELVAERSAELVRANAELARAARLKDEFLASVSHELRTPLAAILGMATLLRDGAHGDLPPEALRDAEVIEASGRKLLGLVNDLLSVARIDAGKVTARRRPCRLADVGAAATRGIGRAAAEKDLAVSLSVDPPELVVETDEDLLAQLLGCLLDNAVKFTPDGGRIGVEIVGDRAAGAARIAVRDTGIGIAPGNLDRLFETFVQLDGRTERSYGGTGLGLALVRRLAALLVGTMEVTSEAGKGSRFTLSLPWEAPAGAAVAAVLPRAGRANEAAPTAAAEPAAAGTRDVLRDRVPADLREPLRAAVLRADLEEIAELVRRLEERDAAVARLVRELSDRFDYEALLAGLGEGTGPAS